MTKSNDALLIMVYRQSVGWEDIHAKAGCFIVSTVTQTAGCHKRSKTSELRSHQILKKAPKWLKAVRTAISSD